MGSQGADWGFQACFGSIGIGIVQEVAFLSF